MAILVDVDAFDDVYQLETTDAVQGGAGGLANTQPQNLANRTRHLKNRVDGIVAEGVLDTIVAGVTKSSLTQVGVLAAPHMTAPVVNSGGLTVTAGGVTVVAGSSSFQDLLGVNLTLTAAAIAVSIALGTSPASAGPVRLANDAYVQSRNAANSANIRAIGVNASNKVSLDPDGVGIVMGGTITGSFVGNASTATALQTARNINGVAFDGTGPITVTAAAGTLTGATLNATVTASSLTSVGVLASPHMTGPTVDSGGLTVTAGTTSLQATTTTTLVATGLITTATSNGFGSALAATGFKLYANSGDGLVLAGFGTANDVSILNRSGSYFLTGTANTQNVVFYGAVSGITTLATTSTINGQTISNAANFTGTGTFAGVLQVPVTVGLALGGTTSAFVALSRSGTTLLVRLADNSGYANLSALAANFDGSVTIAVGDQALNVLSVAGASKSAFTRYTGTTAASAATTYYVGTNPFLSDGSLEIKASGGQGAQMSFAGVWTFNSGVNVSSGTTAVQALTATTVTATGTIKTTVSGMTNPVQLGQCSNAPTYGALTFSNSFASGSIIGFVGGASGDLKLYGKAPSTGGYQFDIADVAIVTILASTTTISSSVAITNPNLTVGNGVGNAGSLINMIGWAGGNKNWNISTASIGTGVGLAFTPSTAGGGSTFTTAVAVLGESGSLLLSAGISATTGTFSSGATVSAGTAAVQALTATTGVFTDVVTAPYVRQSSGTTSSTANGATVDITPPPGVSMLMVQATDHAVSFCSRMALIVRDTADHVFVAAVAETSPGAIPVASSGSPGTAVRITNSTGVSTTFNWAFLRVADAAT